jgi:metal-sulfur cluster biosynthetic enzyme
MDGGPMSSREIRPTVLPSHLFPFFRPRFPGVAPMLDQSAVLEALRTVKDPELNINVVDLGLVYTIQTHEDQVDVEMTLTTPACPAGPEILRNAVGALEALDGVAKANVKLVMSPPWTPDKMSDAARDELGIF